MNVHKAVFCRFQVEGAHSLSTESISGETYQKQVHRHLFHFKVMMNALDDDPEVQNLLNPVGLRRQCLNQFGIHFDHGGRTHGSYWPIDFGNRSTLDIAQWLVEQLWNMFGRGVSVEVSEDGENGAVVVVGAIDPLKGLGEEQ